ncbi:MAG: PH domain-containing protein [Propionibacteriaceae bacterium]|nr:PH domain-containing protein [Propionibacteriaceae bacterium]
MSSDASPDSPPTDDPFDPAGVLWRPLSRKLITVRLLGWGIQAFFMILLGLIVCFVWPTLWVFMGCGVVGLWLIWSAIRIPRWVNRASYAVRDRDLFYRHGLLTRRMVIIPFVRIQYVDINVGPIERQFNLASVSVSTATPAVAATIPGLTPEIATQLRDILTHRENLTGVPVDPSVPRDNPQVVDYAPQHQFAPSPSPYAANPTPSPCASVAGSRNPSSTTAESGFCDFAQNDGEGYAQNDGEGYAQNDGEGYAQNDGDEEAQRNRVGETPTESVGTVLGDPSVSGPPHTSPTDLPATTEGNPS